MQQVSDFRAVKEAVVLLVANQPYTPVPLLWSSTGEGKSSFAEALASALDLSFYQLTASQIDPALVLGIPTPDAEERVTRFFPPEFYAIPRLLLLIDEINTAPESVIAATMETIRTRRLGGRVFEELKIITAANPYEEAAGGFIIPKPLRNRLVHIQWDLPFDEFAAVTALPPHRRKETLHIKVKVASPEAIEAEWGIACGLVDGFLSRFPHHFKTRCIIPDDVNAFPSPRAWDNVKSIIAVFRAVEASELALFVAVAGCVGEGIAAEFFKYIANLDMPAPEEVIEKPELLENLRQDVVLVMLSAIPACVARNPKLAAGALDVARYFERTNKKDYAYLLARRVLQVCITFKYHIPLTKLAQFEDTTFLKQIQELEDALKKQRGGKK